MTPEKRNDEIDLIELFFKIYIFIKKNFWILLLSSILGGVLGYSVKFLTKEQHFESKMIINSNTLSDNFLIDYLNNLNHIIQDKNYIYLSKKMNLESSLLAYINNIKAEIMYNEKENKNLNYITVSVNISNNEILEYLSTGMLNYLNNEPYIKKEIEIYIKNNTFLIEKIDEEIEKLEILQKSFLKPIQNSGEVNIYNDNKSLQEELLELIKEKQNREKNLKFAEPFTIIQDFTIYQNPIRKSVSYTLSGLFLFGFIALFILFIKEINKKTKSLN